MLIIKLKKKRKSYGLFTNCFHIFGKFTVQIGRRLHNHNFDWFSARESKDETKRENVQPSQITYKSYFEVVQLVFSNWNFLCFFM